MPRSEPGPAPRASPSPRAQISSQRSTSPRPSRFGVSLEGARRSRDPHDHPHWGGFTLVADMVELWVSRPGAHSRSRPMAQNPLGRRRRHQPWSAEPPSAVTSAALVRGSLPTRRRWFPGRARCDKSVRTSSKADDPLTVDQVRGRDEVRLHFDRFGVVLQDGKALRSAHCLSSEANRHALPQSVFVDEGARACVDL